MGLCEKPLKEKVLSKDAIPEILTEALAISLDKSIGHNYIENGEDRWEFYHKKETKIPFDMVMLDKITNGGISPKTLTVLLGGTGVGKTLVKTHLASQYLKQGMDVLYITMEMSEERIAERIDANLMDIDIGDLHILPKENFKQKLDKLNVGKLIIKEYPTAGAHVGNFRALIRELKIKKDFVPQVIILDYLNICSSSRVKWAANMNTYIYIKSIAEELRGLAVENKVPIVSATQTTRSGYSNTDVGLEDTSESFGLPATADFMFAIISTEQMEELGQLMVKQLKNRYNDPTVNRKFIVGVNRSKMRLFDVSQAAQKELVDTGQKDDTPSFDIATEGKFKKRDFSGFDL